MSVTPKTSTDQYGRKQWNVDAYEEDARRGNSTLHQCSNEALLRKLKHQDFIQHRANLVDLSIEQIGRHTLVGFERTSISTYGKNKRFGFSCPTCDLTFRDTLALVDHSNSAQHLQNVRKFAGGDFGAGTDLEGGVQRASTALVIQTIEELVKKLRRDKTASESSGSVGLSFQERVRNRVAFEDERKLRKQVRKKRKKEVAGASKGVKNETDVGRLMGFEGFGLTK